MLLFVVRQRDPLHTVPSAFHNVQVVLERSDRLEGHTLVLHWLSQLAFSIRHLAQKD